MLGSVGALKQYLDQFGGTTDKDATLTAILERATAIVETELGYSFDAAAPSTRVVYGDGTDFLTLPDNATVVTAVTTLSGYSVPDYVHIGDLLQVTRNGILGYATPLGGLAGYGYPSGGWQLGVPYTVAATYGYGTAPADITQVALEVAVQLWRFRDSGGSTVVGIEGAGAVTVRNALSPLAKGILDAHRLRPGLGVY